MRQLLSGHSWDTANRKHGGELGATADLLELQGRGFPDGRHGEGEMSVWQQATRTSQLESLHSREGCLIII